MAQTLFAVFIPENRRLLDFEQFAGENDLYSRESACARVADAQEAEPGAAEAARP
jgi:hypothetical protein